MRRFILEENIARFQKLLAGTLEAERRRTVASLLLEAQRDLAITNASLFGVSVPAGPTPKNGKEAPAHRPAPTADDIAAAFQREFAISPHPYMLLDPGPGLAILDINDAYARATMTLRTMVVGRSLFEIFPDNPGGGSGDGVRNLYASLRAAAETRRPHTMAVQRYDVRDPSGNFVLRYWQPRNTPLFGADGRIVRLLHHVEDVTEEVLTGPAG
jgi:PAS domain-containing protein